MWGDYMQQLLDSRGLSHREFSKRCGYSQTMLSRAIKGSPIGQARCPAKPPLKHIEAWGDALHLNPEERERFMYLAHLEHAPPAIQRHIDKLERTLRDLEGEVHRLIDNNSNNGDG